MQLYTKNMQHSQYLQWIQLAARKINIENWEFISPAELIDTIKSVVPDLHASLVEYIEIHQKWYEYTAGDLSLDKTNQHHINLMNERDRAKEKFIKLLNE